MREDQIVARIRKLAETGTRNRSIIKGIGDDCAILRPRANEDLVFTTDFVLEGRHFLLDRESAADIGRKALTRSLSDLAAMGGEPLFCLVSLAVPGELADKWVREFYKGLLGLAAKYSVTLAGGDLSRFDRVIADVMCCGRVPRGKAMMRSVAKPGEAIYVTGALGSPARKDARVTQGIALRRAGVKAAMDISDGLVIDLHRMCVASKVEAELDDIPVADGASLYDALYRGEDYELVFTARSRSRLSLDALLRIGTIRKGKPGEIRLQGKRLRIKGWDHFDESAR
jgi:thiamine-monophosphate kinase